MNAVLDYVQDNKKIIILKILLILLSLFGLYRNLILQYLNLLHIVELKIEKTGGPDDNS